MEDKKLTYTVTITNNETGETDTTDACAIICVINNGERVEASRKLDCDAVDLACTLAATAMELEAILKKHPELKELLGLMMEVGEADTVEETEDK